MARVLNMIGYPINLVAKDGETCQIPTGESKVQDKFCVNVPPKVKVLSLDKPIKKEIVVAEKPTQKKVIKNQKEEKNSGI